MNGNVVGINTAIFSQSGGSVGIGFAVSSNLAQQVANQLRKYGRTKRGWLGVLIQEITEEIAESLGLENKFGALVSSASENGPAFKAGIKSGDVILKFNNIIIKNMKELPKVVAGTPVGKSVPVEIWRDGKTIKLVVTLGELELAEKSNLITSGQPGSNKTKQFPDVGLTVETINNTNKKKYNLKDVNSGALITSVQENSNAFNAGLRAGMIILRVGQVEVDNLDVIEDAFKEQKKKKSTAHVNTS